LERANLAYQAGFGHDEGVLSEHHRQLREKLELFQDRTVEAKQRYDKTVRELRNEKQRQRNRRIRENLERYKNEQPVIDLELQLAGKLVDTKVMEALEHKGFMPPEHLMVIDTMLTMPGATLEAEYQRRINAINAVTVFCGVEEGRPTPRPAQSRRRPATDDVNSCSPAKRQRHSVDDEINQAIESVRIKSEEERPLICFLCVGDPKLPWTKRTKKYATSGSLTRHFWQKHVNPPWSAKGVVECNVCGMELIHKSHLLNHAERLHGTVSRGRVPPTIRQCPQL
jgi:Protein of unknown function (DUF3435)